MLSGEKAAFALDHPLGVKAVYLSSHASGEKPLAIARESVIKVSLNSPSVGTLGDAFPRDALPKQRCAALPDLAERTLSPALSKLALLLDPYSTHSGSGFPCSQRNARPSGIDDYDRAQAADLRPPGPVVT
jgi:hypothetical protein